MSFAREQRRNEVAADSKTPLCYAFGFSFNLFCLFQNSRLILEKFFEGSLEPDIIARASETNLTWLGRTIWFLVLFGEAAMLIM